MAYMNTMKSSAITQFSYSTVQIPLSENFPLSYMDYQVSLDEITMLHHHDVFEIGICFEGFGLYVIGNKIYTYKAGDIVIIGPSLYHRAHTESKDNDKWSFFFFRPEDWGVQTLPENIVLLIDKINSPEYYPVLSTMIKQMHLEVSNKPKHYRQVVHGMCQSIIALIFRVQLQHADENQISDLAEIEMDIRIKKSIDLLLDPENIDATIAELADASNISHSYFRKLFKQETGLTPKEFQTDLKLKKAMSLLNGSSLRIVDIAYECGFKTLSSFNREFVGKYKITPMKWKKYH